MTQLQGDDLDQREPLITIWSTKQKVSYGPFGLCTVDIIVFTPEDNEPSPIFPCKGELHFQVQYPTYWITTNALQKPKCS